MNFKVFANSPAWTNCHSSECSARVSDRNPGSFIKFWTPAFAGVTDLRVFQGIGDLRFSPLIPAWVLLFVIAIGAALLVLHFPRMRRRLGTRRTGTLSLLRLGALAVLAICFLDPASVEKKEKKSSPVIAFFIDTSSTMGLPGKEGKSRLDEAKALLTGGENPLLKSLAGRFEVQVHSLGESSRPLEAGELANLKTAGAAGDLSSAVAKLPSGNVLPVLLSDGKIKGTPSQPVFTIAVGDPGDYRDVWIETVKAPTMAFRG
ncbi:MAG TPA: hypothetical protein VLS90_15015, partial [Thermodesulfobacteriota bacterium]|nr:hypothetical protein [Thermodesulfobacteriota bacterium]